MPETAWNTKEKRLNLLITVKNKQLLGNFQAEIAIEAKQLEAQLKKVVAYTKNVYRC